VSRAAAIALGAIAVAGAAGAAQAAAPAGRVWERPQRISLPNVVDEPQVAVGPDGTATAVWTRGGFEEGTESLRLAIVEWAGLGADGHWSEPEVLSPGTLSIGARVVADARGDVVAAWSGPDGVWTVDRPAGATWGAPFRLSAPGSPSGGVQLAMNGAGEAVAVWLRDAGGGRPALDAARRGADGSWGPAQTISAPDEGVASPAVAIAPDGLAAAVWLRMDGPVLQARAATMDGVWAPAADLSAPVESRTPLSPTEPSVAAGPGGAVAAWSLEDRRGARAVQVAAFTPAAGWEPPRTLAAAQRTPRSPQVAIDGEGTMLAGWGGVEGAVRVAARPRGGPWGAPVVVSRSPGHGCGASLIPRIAGGPAGQAIVVWHELTPLGDVLEASERDPSGAWSTPRDLSAPGSDAPDVAIAQNGAAVAVWVALRRNRGLVEASRLPAVPLPAAAGLPQPAYPELSQLRIQRAGAAGVRVTFRLSRPALMRVGNEPLSGQRGLLVLADRRARRGVNRLLFRPVRGELAPGRYRLTLQARSGTRTSCPASAVFAVPAEAAANG